MDEEYAAAEIVDRDRVCALEIWMVLFEGKRQSLTNAAPEKSTIFYKTYRAGVLKEISSGLVDILAHNRPLSVSRGRD